MNKNLDKQGRWRNKTVSFRMLNEEVTLLDNLEGKPKQLRGILVL